MDTLIGKRIGPYEVRDLIGHGGMATVYRGYQATLNRYVAIKVLADWMSQDTQFVQRFRLEALAAGGLRHPNILTILDAGTFEGQHYIVMDYVPTGTLGDLMRKGPMPPEQAANLTAQIADALDYVHRRGIVHRDMKPTNILMEEDGRPLLADFGIAQAMISGPRLTQTGSAVGTPEYMSPEQGQGTRVDGRSDIYSLGIILYQMLTGKVPFAADTPIATLYQVVNQPPVAPRQINPNIPPYLESIILKAIAKRPEDRFQTGSEMAQALRERRATPLPKGSSSTRPPTPAGGVPAPAPARKRLPLILGGVIGLVAVVGISVLLSGLIPNEPPDSGNATATLVELTAATDTPPPTATPIPPTDTPFVIETVVTLPPTAVGEVLVTTNDEAQIYAGPDEVHPILITVPAGQQVPVSGRTRDNAWWRITIAGITAWIANDLVMAPPEALALPVVSEIPTPPAPTDTPAPSPAPTPTTAPTPTAAQALVTVKSNGNLRAGPGENYAIVGRAAAGQQFVVTARTPANDWWQVAQAGGGSAWISSKVATANAEAQKVATVGLPTQPPAPVQPTKPPATPPPRVFFDFEQFGAWRRGNEPYGGFTATDEQKHSGATAGKLAYTIPNVKSRYVVFTRTPAIPIPNGAKALTLWVYGDNSGAFLNGWVQDAAGEVRAFTFGRVQHSGWQQMTATLDAALPWPQGHVSGPDNGQLDPPLKFHSFVLDAEPVGAASGTIYLDDLGTGDPSSPSPAQPPTGDAGDAPTPPPPPPSSLSGHIVYPSGNTIFVVDAGTKAVWPLAANGRQPDIRGDGRVVYNGSGGGKDNLITVNLNGSLDNMVGAHPEDGYPHWSRTGDSAVFHSTLQGDGRQRIYIQRDMTHREEPGKLMVGNTEVFGAYPTWLKSWRIAFSGCDYWAGGSKCGIWTIDSNGGGQGVQLTQDVQDRSTDEAGGTVLYSSKPTGNWEVYAISEGGGTSLNLTNSPTQDAGATFSPDGRSIAFMSDRGGGWAIWVMNADGGNPQKLIDVSAGFGGWEEERLAWGP